MKKSHVSFKPGARPPKQFMRLLHSSQSNKLERSGSEVTPLLANKSQEFDIEFVEKYFINRLTEYLLPLVTEYRQTLFQILVAFQALITQNQKQYQCQQKKMESLSSELQSFLHSINLSAQEEPDHKILEHISKENFKLADKIQTWLESHERERTELKAELSNFMIALDSLSTFVRTPKSILRKREGESPHITFGTVEKVPIPPLSSPQSSPPNSPDSKSITRQLMIRNGSVSKIPVYPTLVALRSSTSTSSLRTKRNALMNEIQKERQFKTKESPY
jgi:hypothetical protein